MKNLDMSGFPVKIKNKNSQFSDNTIALALLNGIVKRQKSMKFECRSIENKHEN